MARIEPLTFAITGSDNFAVKDELQVSGSVVNPVGHLILSSSAGSTMAMSGNLQIESGHKIIGVDGLILSGTDGNTVVSGNLDILGGGNLNIAGDLIVGGDTTYISSSNLMVEDPLIVLALSQSGTPQFDAGFIVERGSEENRGFIWDESEDRFATIRTTDDGSTAGDVSISDYENLAVRNLTLVSSSIIAENSNLILSSSAGSVIAVSGGLRILPNAAGNEIIQFGGTTSSEPMLKRSGNDLHCRKADDSNYTDFQALEIRGTTIQASTWVVTENLSFGTSGTDPRIVDRGSSGWMLAVATNVNNHINLTYSPNNSKNHDHGLQTNPTMFVHSAVDPDTDNTQWLSLTHDQTDGVISTGSGSLVLSGAAGSIIASGTLIAESINCQGVAANISSFENIAIADNRYLYFASLKRSGLRCNDGTGTSGYFRFFVESFSNNAFDFHNNGWNNVMSDTTPPASFSDPRIRLWANTDPRTDNTQCIGLYHDKTQGVIYTDSGSIRLGPNNGNILLSGSSADATIQFGGTTSSEVMLKRDGAALYSRLADDSAYADIWCAGIHATKRSHIVTGGYGVGLELGAATNSIMLRTSVMTDCGYFFGIADVSGRSNNNFIFGNYNYYNKDHDHDTLSPDPTIFLHSNTSPDDDNTQWLSLTHDQTDGVISTGSGSLYLDPFDSKILLHSASIIEFTGSTNLSAPADGHLLLENNAKSTGILFDADLADRLYLRSTITGGEAAVKLFTGELKSRVVQIDDNFGTGGSTGPGLDVVGLSLPIGDIIRWSDNISHPVGTYDTQLARTSFAELTLYDSSTNLGTFIANTISDTVYTSEIEFSGSTKLSASSDGNLLITNNAGDDGIVLKSTNDSLYIYEKDGTSQTFVYCNVLRTAANVRSGQYFFSGISSADTLLIDNGSHGINLGLGTNDSSLFIVGPRATVSHSRPYGLQTNPTLYVESSTARTTDDTQWMSFAHNKEDGVISTGSGSIYLKPKDSTVILSGSTTANLEFQQSGSIYVGSGSLNIEGNLCVSGTFSRFHEAYVYDNSTVTAINTQDEWHFVSLPTEWTIGECWNGCEIFDGLTGAITVFADGGGGLVTVTSAAHGLIDGDWVTITGTTNYNGVFEVQNKATDTFQITDTWVSDDGTGTFDKSGNIVLLKDATLKCSYEYSAAPSSANSVFEYSIFKNGTILGASTRRNTSGGVGAYNSSNGTGFVAGAAGDTFSVAVRNITNATDITFLTLRLSVDQK